MKKLGEKLDVCDEVLDVCFEPDAFESVGLRVGDRVVGVDEDLECV